MDDATTVFHVCTKLTHKAHLDDYASYEAAEHRAVKFLRKTIDEMWYNDLKDANTFYTKVLALEIISFLNANSGDLHAIDMISLHTNMHNYYVQVDGIAGGCPPKGKAGRNAQCQCGNHHDELSGCACGATLLSQSGQLGRPHLRRMHVDSMEKSILPLPPQASATAPSFGGGNLLVEHMEFSCRGYSHHKDTATHPLCLRHCLATEMPPLWLHCCSAICLAVAVNCTHSSLHHFFW